MDAPKTTTTQRRQEAAYNFFLKTYEEDRVRYDDAVEQAAEKYFYEINTMLNIIRFFKKNQVA